MPIRLLCGYTAIALVVIKRLYGNPEEIIAFLL